MKPYMAFSRNYGPPEGAFLVIANNAREAKKLAWKQCPMDFMEYIDLGIRLIRDDSAILLANQAKLETNQPHVVLNPIHCEACQQWGAGLAEDNLCGNCNEYPGDALVHHLERS